MPKSSTNASRKRKSPRPPSSVLVLELDSGMLNLQRQSLAYIGSRLKTVSDLCTQLGVAQRREFEVVRAMTQRNLLDQLAALNEAGKTFDVVAVIAHSDDNEIQIASDAIVTWPVFSGYLKPFKPRRLLLVACQAGLHFPSQALFRPLRSLRRIYASPVVASRAQGELMLSGLLPYVTSTNRPKKDYVRLAQLVLVLLDGGQMRQWMRDDMNNENVQTLDAVSVGFDPLLRQLFGSRTRSG